MNPQIYETPRILAPNEPHLACILLLDTSGSMSGQPIESLNNAIKDFKEKVSRDDTAKKRVDIAIIEFNDTANVVQEFAPICEMSDIHLEASGCTAMGAAINLAIDKVKERTRFYATELGVQCHKPWIFMITDGAPTDDITNAAARIKEEENKGAYGKLKFWALGVPGFDKETLFKLTKRVFALTDTNFEGIFNWLAESMAFISVSKPDDKVPVKKELPQNTYVPDSYND